MRWLAGAGGALLLAGVLWDAFELVVLPRRVNRRLRLSTAFYRTTWSPFARLASLVKAANRRESVLSFYGPLSLVLLLGLWATGLVIAFALIQYAAGSRVRLEGSRPGLLLDLYMSGSTFFSLGLGDVEPVAWRSRVIMVGEAALGFGFLALVIGYFPVIYQAFSRRELAIALLDARAGSPPSAVELLRRHRGDEGMQALRDVLHEWEHSAAELLETHLSYPMLAYFRSQHSNESWLGALTAVLDTCALLLAGTEGPVVRQARLTFANARHALVDLAQVFRTPPDLAASDRLPPDLLATVRDELEAFGLPLPRSAEADERLTALRRLYEPYAVALARHLRQPLPAWHNRDRRRDNWQTSAWDKGAAAWLDEHF
jgi:hypothetical protein